MTQEQINNIFTYHKPFGTQQERYQVLRSTARNLAMLIQDVCPESQEKDLALVDLRKAIMWANSAIAVNETE